MTKSFQAVLAHRNELLNRRAIWQEVVDHLGKFLDTDAVKATVGIKTEGEGLVVPQSVIEAEIMEIRNGYVAEIENELNNIDKSEVAENVDKKNQVAAKKGRQSKAGKKAPRRQKAATRSKAG